MLVFGRTLLARTSSSNAPSSRAFAWAKGSIEILGSSRFKSGESGGFYRARFMSTINTDEEEPCVHQKDNTSRHRKAASLQGVWTAQREGADSTSVLAAFAKENGVRSDDLTKFVTKAEEAWDVGATNTAQRIADIEEDMLNKYVRLSELEGQHISIMERAERHATRTLWGGVTTVLAQGLAVGYITYAPELKERFGIDIMVDWFGSFDPWDQGWDQWGWDFAEPVTYFLAFGTALTGYIWFLTTRTEHEYENMYTYIRDRKMRAIEKAEGYDPSEVSELRRHLWLLGKELRDLRGVEISHSTGVVPVRSDHIVDALSDVIDLSHESSKRKLQQLAADYHAALTEYTQIGSLKESLDTKAIKAANRKMYLGGVGMTTTFFLTAMGTWEWASWDLVEPITYFLGFSSVLFGAIWFSTTKTEFSYDAVRERFRKQVETKLYRRNVLDVEQYDKLEGIINDTQSEYDHLHRRVYGKPGDISLAVKELGFDPSSSAAVENSEGSAPSVA